MEGTAARLTREARLIEGLREVVERYVGVHSRVQSAEAMSSLANRIRLRIQLEEETLFPALERLVGDPRFPPTARLRRQHVVLLDLVVGIEDALGAGELAAAAGDLRELKAALHAHLEEERRVLHPILGAEGHA